MEREITEAEEVVDDQISLQFPLSFCTIGALRTLILDICCTAVELSSE